MKVYNTLRLISLSTVMLIAATPAFSASLDTDSDGIPDSAEALLGTDPITMDTDGDGIDDKNDKKPVLIDHPVVYGTQPSGVILANAKAEDNFDPITKKDVADHIELGITNQTDQPIKGLKVILNIRDLTSKDSESYFRYLSGLTLAPQSSTTIHFSIDGTTDFSAKVNHFRLNPNSIYYRSMSAKDISIEVVTPFNNSTTVTIHKDKGGAEQAD
jgi:hypothetical protein